MKLTLAQTHAAAIHHPITLALPLDVIRNVAAGHRSMKYLKATYDWRLVLAEPTK